MKILKYDDRINVKIEKDKKKVADYILQKEYKKSLSDFVREEIENIIDIAAKKAGIRKSEYIANLYKHIADQEEKEAH